MWNRSALRPALALAVLLACRSGGSRGPQFQPVADADFGRLSPEQIAPVTTARADAAAARDAVSRAQLRLQDARHEADFARADQTAARADLERAAAQGRASRESGDPNELARATELGAAAQLRQQSADAHAEYASRIVEARNADLVAAQAEQSRAEAALERAKLAALEQARIPAAQKYDPAKFDAHVARATRDAEAARTRASQSERAAQQALANWRTLQQRWQARAGGNGRG
jgi:hypothetical protein